MKGTFRFHNGGILGIIKDQAPISEADEFYGEENASSLRRDQEIAPQKIGTDILIHATARAPAFNGKPPEAITDWPVSVEVKDRLFYEFRVRGPLEWRKEKKGWRLSDPAPVTEVPIRYELAYGGTIEDEDEGTHYDYNPVGRGFVNRTLLNGDDPIPAPQIGDLAEFSTPDINSPMTVHGFGPIAKSWLPRRVKAGTFDTEWQITRHPRMPKDYSVGFWNAAHSRLQVEGTLRGDETIIMRGLRHDCEPYSFTLPGQEVIVHKNAANGPIAQLNLDTVEIDVDDIDETNHRVHLMWRGFYDAEGLESLHIRTRKIPNTEKKDSHE